mgnify:FL=1
MAGYVVDTRSLYDVCFDKWRGERPDFQAACAWTEASNTMVVWKLIQRWFERMEDGTAEKAYPSFRAMKRQVTQEMADELVEELDADFEIEHHRFPEGYGPEFCRLSSLARLAFAQEMAQVMKTDEEIQAEAAKRLAEGELMPRRIE